MLPWYRSWPEDPPAERAHVVDELPHLVMRDHNYATLEHVPDHQPGWCLLEWDVALDRTGRANFAAHALEQPDRILVAPYHVYPGDRPPEQVHRNHGRSVTIGTPTCTSFGLGCIYLPATILTHFHQQPPATYTRHGLITDTTLSDWHRHHYGPARIDWTTLPQHIHGD